MRARMKSAAVVGSIFAGLVFVSLSRAADFAPPANGKLTDKEVGIYIDILKEQMDAYKSAGKAVDGNKSSAADIAIMMRANEKVDASIAKHGMTKEEYNWVGGEVGKLWYAAVMQEQWEDNAKPDMERQIKEKETDKDAAKTKMATYEQANKDGKRILTKEQQDAAVQSAASDRDSIAQEVKDRQADLKTAKDEVAQHEKEAADADALAKNPPADVSADDKPGYIDGKKGEAQTARDAAKDSGTKVTDAQKAVDDAKARLAVANGKVDHPEVPVTDDEKTQVTQDNQKGIDDAKKAIDDDDQVIASLKDTLAAGAPKFDQGTDKMDPDNLALVKKHVKDYLTAIGASDMLKAK